jgi:alkylation response protein AidB-like acyl-CoA dehydrogenase
VHFELTDDQEDLQASVRAVLDRECPMSLVRDIAEATSDTTAARRLRRTASELGWPAIAVPQEHGGLGRGFVEVAIVVEELGRALAPLPYLSTVTQFAPAVAAAGDTEQQKRFLSGIAAGDVTGTAAFAEGGLGAESWAAHDVTTTATPSGDGWVLDGRKRFVTDATVVDELVVTARTPSGEVGMFVVPTAAPGVRVEPMSGIDLTRTLCDVSFAGAAVTADRVLGRPGEVDTAVSATVEAATAGLSVEMLGVCEALFNTTLDYAKDRHQFGVPIGSFQAVKHKLADMYVVLERARAMCYFAALTIAEEDDRRRLAVSMAKAATGDCQRLIAKEAIQIHGGIGYTWECDVHLYVKRAKSIEALFGTSRAHRRAVAHSVLHIRR